MRYKWFPLILILLGVTAIPGRADTSFIIDLTAKTSMFGYSQGEDYEWTLVVNGDYDVGATTPGTYFSWANTEYLGGTLFESLTGDGISGTIVSGFEYANGVGVFSSGRIYLSGNTNGGGYGLTPDNTTIWGFSFDLASNIGFVISGALPSVDDYFVNYSQAGTGTSLEAFLNGEDLFTLNSITIVPEPTVWALLLIGGAGCVALARRRAKASQEGSHPIAKSRDQRLPRIPIQPFSPH